VERIEYSITNTFADVAVTVIDETFPPTFALVKNAFVRLVFASEVAAISFKFPLYETLNVWDNGNVAVATFDTPLALATSPGKTMNASIIALTSTLFGAEKETCETTDPHDDTKLFTMHSVFPRVHAFSNP